MKHHLRKETFKGAFISYCYYSWNLRMLVIMFNIKKGTFGLSFGK
jgi:hypothetical protein